jgi:transcriptional regulator with XRE-family HTH domain
VRRLTQEELAEAVRISVEYVSKIERGLASSSFAVIAPLAKVLKSPGGAFLALQVQKMRDSSSARNQDANGLNRRTAALMPLNAVMRQVGYIGRRKFFPAKPLIRTRRSLPSSRSLRPASFTYRWLTFTEPWRAASLITNALFPASASRTQKAWRVE